LRGGGEHPVPPPQGTRRPTGAGPELIGQAAAVPDPAQAARLAELLATGQYPRFAAAVAQGGLPPADLTVQFERLLDRILDGLVQPVSDTPGLALLGDGEGFGDAIRLRR
jgi:hypothetical protein